MIRTLERREVMEAQVNTIWKDSGLHQKRQNGLMFDKAFDGV